MCPSTMNSSEHLLVEWFTSFFIFLALQISLASVCLWPPILNKLKRDLFNFVSTLDIFFYYTFFYSKS